MFPILLKHACGRARFGRLGRAGCSRGGGGDLAGSACLLFMLLFSMCCFVYVLLYVCRYVYIYIYREREIERERCYVYIYRYTHISCIERERERFRRPGGKRARYCDVHMAHVISNMRNLLGYYYYRNMRNLLGICIFICVCISIFWGSLETITIMRNLLGWLETRLAQNTLKYIYIYI